MRKLIGIAAAIGARYIRTFAGQLPPGSNHDEMTLRVAKALRPLCQDAAQRGLVIGMETHDDWCGGDRVMKLVKHIDSPGFGLVYDVFNLHSCRHRILADDLRNRQPHISYCHIKDGYFINKTEYVYTMAGAGDLPMEEILQRFKRDGYASYRASNGKRSGIRSWSRPNASFRSMRGRFAPSGTKYKVDNSCAV